MAPTLAEVARRLQPSGRSGAGWAARGRPPLPPLLLLSDAARLPDPVAAASRLPRGAGIVLRHYEAPERAALARALAELARARGLVLLVAGDERLAAAIGAHGLHLPEHLSNRIRGLRRRRPGWLITVAAHSQAALVAARGADAALLSPAFATLSHPGAAALGPLRFSRLVRDAPVPVYALGGIDAARMRRLRAVPVAGFAAIGALA